MSVIVMRLENKKIEIVSREDERAVRNRKQTSYQSACWDGARGDLAVGRATKRKVVRTAASPVSEVIKLDGGVPGNEG